MIAFDFEINNPDNQGYVGGRRHWCKTQHQTRTSGRATSNPSRASHPAKRSHTSTWSRERRRCPGSAKPPQATAEPASEGCRHNTGRKIHQKALKTLWRPNKKRVKNAQHMVVLLWFPPLAGGSRVCSTLSDRFVIVADGFILSSSTWAFCQLAAAPL